MVFDDPLGAPKTLLGLLAPGSMWARFLLGNLILLYAIWTDLRHRRVSNRVWIVTLVLGAGLALYDWARADPPPIYYLIVPAIMAVAYLLWRLRLLFGGADAKCVMAFALLVPYPPALFAGSGTFYPHLVAIFPTSVTMLTNAVLLTLFVPLVFFVSNLAKGDVHPLAMWLGRRVPLEKVFTDPVWVMEWVRPVPGSADEVEEGPPLADTTEDPDLDEEGLPVVDPATIEGADVRLHYMPTRAGDYALNLARLRALGVKEVWVTPKVPFMVPLFFGFLVAWLAGDLILSGVFWVSGML